MSLNLKCRKCRALLPSCGVLTGHGVEINVDNIHRPDLSTDCVETVNSLYLKEETLPTWVTEQVDKAEWIKGKLTCPKCSARLGSFDFVSGRKCSCGSHIVPSVHVIKSKVDF